MTGLIWHRCSMCGERWIGTHECAPVQSKPFKAITEIVRDALRETAKIDPEFRYCARCKEWVRDTHNHDVPKDEKYERYVKAQAEMVAAFHAAFQDANQK